ncbi:hypothetical protein EJ03DRAFT_349473 [Teratosphaeria nubilosa]|uniref:Uncharacterized protein n=1 Tax=Teratosphaeria nubilosa TaxID=161662 RepID=A0A6G1LEU0_9PEZI|nr:hypothetical protein EJ03DRAFT_349473 [Teratosphaeria nubilosa]
MPSLRNIEIGEWCKPEEDFQLGWGGYALEREICSFLKPHHYEIVGSYDGFQRRLTRPYREGSHYDYEEGAFADAKDGPTFIFDTMLIALSIAQPKLQSLSAGLWTDSPGFYAPLKGIHIGMVQPLSRIHGGLHSDELFNFLKHHWSRLKQVTLTRVRLDESRANTRDWVKIVEELRRLDQAPSSIDPICLYEADKKVIYFDENDLVNCKCQEDYAHGDGQDDFEAIDCNI